MKVELISKALKEKLTASRMNIEGKANNISQKLMLFTGGIDKRIMQLNFLIMNFPRQIENLFNKVENLEKLFLSYNPKNVLQKGYSYITGENGEVMSDIDSFKVEQKINVNFATGSLFTNILKINKKSNENR
jgi:exonuclease VII large subunit